jgi:prolyl-tRNA editing enzyme YbaK/EbsC (Cys-tRNA(Pro) deacylase)
MAFDKAKAYLAKYGLADRIIVTEHSSATVAEAAEALGCAEEMIAKTLSFLQGEKPVLILADGVARIDNRKYKDRFGCKARMIPADLVEPLIGHDIGGVCPFGVNDGVTVFLDESLRKHEIVYPAVGTDHSGVKLTIPELERCCSGAEWVDISKSSAYEM